MMRGVNRLRRTITRWRGRLFPGAIILLYHRIAELPSDPFGLAVTPRAFAEHLEVLRTHGRPISLQHLVRALRGGTVPRKAVVVTFDDGYADNLHAAKPLLEQFDVPATVFISPGYIGQEREFWWDELEGLLLRPGPCPRAPRDWREEAGAPGPDGAADYGDEDYRRHRQWRYSDHDLPHARHRLFRSLYLRLQALSPDERDRASRQLRETVGVAPEARPEYRVMTREELVRLAHGSLIDVGGHTTHHPLLPALPGPAQRREILGCKSWLEETLERRIEDFSYPHGGFTAETREYIREAGFSSACSTRAAVVLGRDDPFALPRVVPESGGGDGFSRFLHAWFSGEPWRA